MKTPPSLHVSQWSQRLSHAATSPLLRVALIGATAVVLGWLLLVRLWQPLLADPTAGEFTPLSLDAHTTLVQRISAQQQQRINPTRTRPSPLTRERE